MPKGWDFGGGGEGKGGFGGVKKKKISEIQSNLVCELLT